MLSWSLLELASSCVVEVNRRSLRWISRTGVYRNDSGPKLQVSRVRARIPLVQAGF